MLLWVTQIHVSHIALCPLNRGRALGSGISLRTLGGPGFRLRPSLVTSPFLPYPPQGSSDFCVDPDTFVTKMVEENSVLSGGESVAMHGTGMN